MAGPSAPLLRRVELLVLLYLASKVVLEDLLPLLQTGVPLLHLCLMLFLKFPNLLDLMLCKLGTVTRYAH